MLKRAVRRVCHGLHRVIRKRRGLVGRRRRCESAGPERTGSGGYTGPQLNTSTIFDDADVDNLQGEGDQDWFFAKLGEDLIDQEAGEELTAL